MDDKLKLMQDLLDEIKHLNNLTPSICTKSADAHSISDDIIHEDTDPREVARSAYDSENYAKCIRTIEKLMSRDGTPLER
uniref:Uncharacterized protein n=1 Tax=Parascaris equorum TaxID=6256 RepID=A0A914S0L8_PAREQ